MTGAFFAAEGDHFVATELTRGPWDNRFQHGGPPSALVTGTLERFGEDASRWFLARIHLELLRPVPIGPLTVEIQPERLGRTVQRLSATLLAGDVAVLRAAALRIRRGPGESSTSGAASSWPEPEECPRLVFDFFQHEVGYHRAVDLRTAHGAWGRTPIGIWTRPSVALVEGRPWTPRERVVALADAQSGMGVPLDPQEWSFVNPDLSVFFERDPVGDWVGFDVRSTANVHGSGLSQSELRDAMGTFGRSAQTLVVTPRG